MQKQSGGNRPGAPYSNSRRVRRRKKQRRMALLAFVLLVLVAATAALTVWAAKAKGGEPGGGSSGAASPGGLAVSSTPNRADGSRPADSSTGEDSSAQVQPGTGASPSPIPLQELPAILQPYYQWLTDHTQEELRAITAGWSKEYVEEDPPLLFNYEHYIPETYYDALELVSVGVRPSSGEDQRMETRAAAAFKAMQAAAKEAGHKLSPYSGYRSHQRQVNNYNASIQRYRDQGHSEEEAIRRTRQYYAIPGTSEHEAGLAMDINGIETSFEKTAEFAWLQENAASFGFILRYPRDKADLTQVSYEPWHYRYVGVNHAYLMGVTGYCLEEYMELLAAADQYPLAMEFTQGGAE